MQIKGRISHVTYSRDPFYDSVACQITMYVKVEELPELSRIMGNGTVVITDEPIYIKQNGDLNGYRNKETRNE